MIALYLSCLLERYHIVGENQFFLPPIRRLAQFFQCQVSDVYAALQGLKKKGFDYLLFELDNPILVVTP